MPTPVRDLTGQQFGKLTVIERAPNSVTSPRTGACWRCVCECGQERINFSRALTNGSIKSCGCNRGEAIRLRNLTHGMTDSREYKSWISLRLRCFSEKDKDYADYGGRGITVCGEWASSFESFYRDMGPCPPGHSIDRKDTNGNYEPGNCRWATIDVQANNRRSNRPIELNGETLNLTQWARRLGTSAATIRARLFYGWTIEEALTTPTQKYVKRSEVAA
jgi:hypothetical protein